MKCKSCLDTTFFSKINNKKNKIDLGKLVSNVYACLFQKK